MAKDFNEWRIEYPDGTRILWHEYLIKKAWLPGTIKGYRCEGGEGVLLFRLHSEPPRARLLRTISFKNRKLLKKQ